MCNHYRLRTNEAELAAAFGVRASCNADRILPIDDIFPTGKKTAAYSTVIVQDGGERVIEPMEWGVPTQVQSKRTQR